MLLTEHTHWAPVCWAFIYVCSWNGTKTVSFSCQRQFPWWWRYVFVFSLSHWIAVNCFQVSPLWCGACSLPSLSFGEWCDSVGGPASVWMKWSWMFKHAPHTCRSDLNGSCLIAFLPPLLLQVSLLEYRKRKQCSSRDSEPVGSSSSLGSTPTRPSSHYIQDSHHPQSHQQMQPPASPHSSFSSSAHTSIPQIEEVSPPDHQGSSLQSRRQDSSNQWWAVQNDGVCQYMSC